MALIRVNKTASGAIYNENASANSLTLTNACVEGYVTVGSRTSAAGTAPTVSASDGTLTQIENVGFGDQAGGMRVYKLENAAAGTTLTASGVYSNPIISITYK